MKVPGFKSFAAKSPDWPFAGWERVTIGVILTREQGPFGVLAGIEMTSFGRVRRDDRWSGVRLGE